MSQRISSCPVERLAQARQQSIKTEAKAAEDLRLGNLVHEAIRGQLETYKALAHQRKQALDQALAAIERVLTDVGRTMSPDVRADLEAVLATKGPQ